MSDTLPPDLKAPKQEAGWVFRAEMWVVNALLGYWKHLVAVAIAVIVALLVYGQYQNHVQAEQRRGAGLIADVQADLLGDLSADLDPGLQNLLARNGYDLAAIMANFRNMDGEQQLEFVQSGEAMQVLFGFQQIDAQTRNLILSGSDPLSTLLMFTGTPDEATRARIAAAGESLVEEAQGLSRSPRDQAFLLAAEYFRVAERPEARQAALEEVQGTWRAPFHFAAVVGLAHLDLGADDLDAAVARLEGLADHEDTFVAQQATLALAEILEDADRPGEARAVYDRFLERWEDDWQVEMVEFRRDNLQEAG